MSIDNRALRAAWPAAAVVAIAFIVVALPAVALGSTETPRNVRLSWTSTDTARTMTIAWDTYYERGSTVHYGLDTSYGSVATGDTYSIAAGPGWMHEVTLEDLEPDTVYHYRVGDPMAGPTGWSEDLTFRTGPEYDGCTPFSFVALGDNRSDDESGASPHWSPILGESLEHDPGFVVNTGDLVKSGDEADQWTQFLSESADHTAVVPLLPSLGNHDDDHVQGDGALYNQVFALPRNDVTQTEDYYYVLYGNAIVVSLSSQTYTGGETSMADQAAWLDRVLTENPRPWKIVFFHHPPYTGIVDIFGWVDLNHPPNEKDQNAALVPIFDKHHVDIVFNGHNHFYERFEPMIGGENPEEGSPVEDYSEGTVYVVTGGAGALTYDIELYMAVLCGVTPGSAVCSGRHHYVLIDIDGNKLTYTALSTAQQILGSNPGNVEVLDSFEIVKDDVVIDCTPPPPEPSPELGSPDVAQPEPDVVDVIPAVDIPTPPEDIEEDVPAPAPDTGTAKPDQGATGGDSAAADIAQDAGGQPPSTATSGGGGCATGTGDLPLVPSLVFVLLLLVRTRIRRRSLAALR